MDAFMEYMLLMDDDEDNEPSTGKGGCLGFILLCVLGCIILGIVAK